MAVWMGTTIACAQCHDHKYDPLSQEEFFRLFAFFNNTEDADRTDESPTLPLCERRAEAAEGRLGTGDRVAREDAADPDPADPGRPSALGAVARVQGRVA